MLLQPDTVGSLPSLEELWLDCNEISELPPVAFLFILLILSAADTKPMYRILRSTHRQKQKQVHRETLN